MSYSIATPGCSAFGLLDCVAQQDRCALQEFYLADAVLPTSAFGRIRVGDEAEEERVDSGYHWPLEASVAGKERLRRAPIPALWRGLVAAGDRSAAWRTGNSSFPLQRILAAHITGLLPSGQEQHPVVAIPDHLDEYGQEGLLKELAAQGVNNATLLWRPVAAALAWLDAVQDQLEDPGEDDHILVAYLGADALELTVFKLRRRDHDNRRFIVPLRSRPEGGLPPSGMEWGALALERILAGNKDPDAFWQAFTTFPEVWNALAMRPLDTAELPRPWSSNGGWTLWNPDAGAFDFLEDLRFGGSRRLRALLKRSLDSVQDESEASGESWGQILRRLLGEKLRALPEGRLQGVVACGPFAARFPDPGPLDRELAPLDSLTNGFSSKPLPRAIWMPPFEQDPVALGAAVYGQRLQNGEPGYLDTLPQLSILAQEERRLRWIPLVEARECLGGTEYNNFIEKKFQLEKNKDKLDVHLLKGEQEEADAAGDERHVPQSFRDQGLKPCWARLVRAVVHSLGSYERVSNCSFFVGNDLNARYGLYYAGKLFAQSGEGDAEHLETRGRFRKTNFEFPDAPTDDEPLDVEVRMKPASGLARVEILPANKEFLQGRRVFLNYQTMRETDSLPQLGQGWPPVQEIVVDPDDFEIRNNSHIAQQFLNVHPGNNTYYVGMLKAVASNLFCKKRKFERADFSVSMFPVGIDGRPCTDRGAEIIDSVRIKMEDDFSRLVENDLKWQVALQASRLYNGAPEVVKSFFRTELPYIKAGNWIHLVKAAGRVLHTKHDLELLCKLVARRTTKEGLIPFPMQSADALGMILRFHESAPSAMTGEQVFTFAEKGIERLWEEDRKGKYKNLYFSLIEFLLYLLRFRIVDEDCFNPDDAEAMQPFEEAKRSMKNCRAFYEKRNDTAKVNRVAAIIEGFDNYLHYRGDASIVSVIRQEAEE